LGCKRHKKKGESQSKPGSFYPEKKTTLKSMRVWFDFQGIQIMSDDVIVIFVPKLMISN
jgi:hypothetical protein